MGSTPLPLPSSSLFYPASASASSTSFPPSSSKFQKLSSKSKPNQIQISRSARDKDKDKERKEEVNRKIASKKAISVILRREATKAVIEKKRGGTNSKKLLPRTVLEALHERVTALRWESALQVFELLREQMWYRPNTGIYIKLMVMLGKCKQPEKAHELFVAMQGEGCVINHESYTALLSAYSRSGLFHDAFSLLEKMKNTAGCHPDVHTYSILIKSCLHVYAFDKVWDLMLDMRSYGVRPNTVTYNTLVDTYGRVGRFEEMEAMLVEMLSSQDCTPDVWTMNATLRAYGASGQIDTMEKCYDKFTKSGISPTIKTFNILLDSYGKAKMFQKMGAVMEFMQKYYYSWTIVTYNVVIDAFGRAGELKQMEYIFRLMKSERIKPNCVTLCSLVKAYGRAGDKEMIKAVIKLIENSDVLLDTPFFNCLVDAYARVGCLGEMQGVLDMMEKNKCKPGKQRQLMSWGITDTESMDFSIAKICEKFIPSSLQKQGELKHWWKAQFEKKFYDARFCCIKQVIFINKIWSPLGYLRRRRR